MKQLEIIKVMVIIVIIMVIVKIRDHIVHRNLIIIIIIINIIMYKVGSKWNKESIKKYSLF